MFQTICLDGSGWDTSLEGELAEQWSKIISELNELNDMEVSRCYFRSIDNIVCRQIHGFSNASKNGYAAVVYLRTEHESGVVDIRLVASKTNKGPINSKT